MCTCVCVPECYHVCTETHRGQKRVSETWELELQMVMSSHVGLGTELGSPAKAATTPNH